MDSRFRGNDGSRGSTCSGIATGHLAAGLLLASALLLLACQRSDNGPVEGSQVGRTAPAIKLETLDHRRFYLNEQRGKPVVLVFWNTTCQACKKEMVELEKLRRQIGPERVVMASVCNDPENLDDARRLVAGLQLGYPTLLDPDAKISRQYGVDELPTTVVISPDGKISFFREGYTEPLLRQIRTTVESHL